MTEKDHEVRLAVAESKLEMHSIMLESNQELTARIVDRFDLHLQESMKRDDDIRSELANVTVAITANNAAVISLTNVVADATEVIKEVSIITRNNQIDLVQINTAWHTVAKVAAVVAIVVSGIWAVGTYVTEKYEHQQIIEIKK